MTVTQINRPCRMESSRLPTLLEFETGSLNPEEFTQEAHVYIAWKLLEEGSVPEALGRFCSALRKLTHQLGIPGKYHETITGFFILLIAERRALCGQSTWEGFAADNLDLIQGSGSVLHRYYSAARLQSSLARSQFLLPDRVENPKPHQEGHG